MDLQIVKTLILWIGFSFNRTHQAYVITPKEMAKVFPLTCNKSQ